MSGHLIGLLKRQSNSNIKIIKLMEFIAYSVEMYLAASEVCGLLAVSLVCGISIPIPQFLSVFSVTSDE